MQKETVSPRCTSIKYLDNGSEDNVLESFVYTYDKNSQILTCRHINNLPAEDKRIDETRTYTYDSYGQLTESVITDHKNSDVQSVTIYTYHKVGNRTAMTRDGQVTEYTYNGLNQLVEADTPDAIIEYTYDGRGNQITEYSGMEGITTAYTYSVTGEMTGMTVSGGDVTTFTQENQYNHEGIRISKTEGGVTRKYYYDNGIVAYTKDESTVSSANVLSGDGDILGTYRGEDYHVYTKDIQNSAESVIREDGSLAAAYSYSDFGETEELTESIFDNEICYTGAVYDASSGLHYMNARYYNPANGRFISQDIYRGELDDADQWHLYAYCANNPINYVDPSGHFIVRRWMISVPIDVILSVCPLSLNSTMTFLFKEFTRASKKYIRKACKINIVLSKYRSLCNKYKRAMNSVGQYTVKKIIKRYTGLNVKSNKGIGFKIGRMITETANQFLASKTTGKVIQAVLGNWEAVTSIGNAIAYGLDKAVDGRINNKIVEI